jgi:hypothetical protein
LSDKRRHVKNKVNYIQINKLGTVNKDLGYFNSHVDVDGLPAFYVLRFGK